MIFMMIFLGKRFYFNNEDGLIMLEDSVPKFDAFNSLREEHNYPIELSVYISTNEDKLNSEQKERADRVINKIRNKIDRVLYDKKGATAGQKFISQIHESYLFPTIPGDTVERPNDSILGLCCFDQYPLEKEEHLDAIMDLGKKLVHDKKLYATGSRNMPVQLFVNKVPSDMRIVHELVQLLATRSDSFRAEKPKWANPSTHYEYLGELCSGLYLFNPDHHLFHSQCIEIRNKRVDVFEKPGFTIDYFTAMHAGLNNAVTNGYVYAERNPFYAQIDEQTEIAKASNFIRAQTSLVGKTSVSHALETVLIDNGELNRLNEFFDKS